MNTCTATAIVFLGAQKRTRLNVVVSFGSTACRIQQQTRGLYLSGVRSALSPHPRPALARAATGSTPVSVVSTEEASVPFSLFPVLHLFFVSQEEGSPPCLSLKHFRSGHVIRARSQYHSRSDGSDQCNRNWPCIVNARSSTLPSHCPVSCVPTRVPLVGASAASYIKLDGILNRAQRT